MRSRAFRALLVAHGVVTAAAGVVLVVAPGAIPAAVGVDVADGARLVPLMLAAAEFAVAALSFGGARITDARASRLVATTMIVFHLATAGAEAYAYLLGGVNGAIWANVAVRLVVAGLFGWLGLRPTPGTAPRADGPVTPGERHAALPRR